MIHHQGNHRPIAPNHAGYLPRYLISFDAETLPIENGTTGRRFSHRFRLATATIGRMVGTEAKCIKRQRFVEKGQVWEWLVANTRKNYTTWIVAHNALFDMIVCGLMERLESADLVIEWPRSKRQSKDSPNGETLSGANCVIESPPTIIACRIVATGARVVFVDSLNWFPVSLAAMGERLGMAKLPMPEWKAPDSEWFTYCQRDSDIVFYTFVELFKWCKANDLGMFRYTAPSQAMAAYRHRFMEHKIYLHDNADVKCLERSGYFGGRTEVFKRGAFDQTVYQLDVNSLFPYVMRDGLFPVVLDRYEMRSCQLELQPDLDWSRAVASVEIETTAPIYPMRTKSCVLYPIGRFRTILCGTELADAHRNGRIRKVGAWSEYRLKPIFHKWVSEVYALRRQCADSGNLLYADFTKRLLNSLYGKFGERSPKWVNVNNDRSGLPWTTWIEFDPQNGEPINYRMMGWQCQRRVEASETPKSFVAIAAFVTAAARQYMNQLRETAGARNVYYQGVDCLIVTKDGLERLDAGGFLHATELGKLKLLDIATSGEIMGCADYRMNERVILAGRARKIEELSDGTILQRKFHAATALFNGKTPTEIVEDLQEWRRSSIVSKGTVGIGGWVKPFELSLNT